MDLYTTELYVANTITCLHYKSHTHNLFSHYNLIESVVTKSTAEIVDLFILHVYCVNDVIGFVQCFLFCVRLSSNEQLLRQYMCLMKSLHCCLSATIIMLCKGCILFVSGTVLGECI